jgi:hypothetical protein
MSGHTGKYVPPHLRNPGSSSGTLLALSSTKATALRDWLNTLSPVGATFIGTHGGGGHLEVMQLTQQIAMDDADRTVRYNVHANLAGGTMGSTWVEGVTGVAINAQDNTRSATLLQLWRDAKAALTTTTTTSPN